MTNKKPMTLTSVKVKSDLFENFKIECVKRKFSFQKLADRSLFLYLTDEDFRKQITNQINLDIKTSTKGWNSYDKKNEDKHFQLILYKKFFSEQYGIPLDKIEIEFLIVKRKVLDWDDEKIMSPHQAYRVQQFVPPSGKIKINRASNAVKDFITECFSSSGKIKEIDYPKSPSKWNCTFCPYGEDKELCGAKVHFE